MGALLDRASPLGFIPLAFIPARKLKTHMAIRASGGLLENLKTILFAGLIAVGIRTVAFEPFNIPSGSMIPTLEIGDYLFVSKYSYGYSRYSLPFSPPLFAGRIFNSLPKRGDVAVFKYPGDNRTDYIKRIVGLPGDTIRVTKGILFVNGQAVPRIAGPPRESRDDSGILVRGLRFTETLPGGAKYNIQKFSDDGFPNNTNDFAVPAGRIFVMGDNRDASSDSRLPNSGVGFVPLENLVGRAEVIFFSIESTSPRWQFWMWPFEIRWKRLFSGIN